MKVILRNYGIRMSTEQRQVARSQAQDMVLARGTSLKPRPPRDLFVQPGPRGVLLNWLPPSPMAPDLAGWRVYKDDENKLFAEVRDPGTTQHFVEATASSTPPTTNFFVSSFNKLGVESAKIMIQGKASTEASAPSMPSTPPTFTTKYVTTRSAPRGFNTL